MSREIEGMRCLDGITRAPIQGAMGHELKAIGRETLSVPVMSWFRLLLRVLQFPFLEARPRKVRAERTRGNPTSRCHLMMCKQTIERAAGRSLRSGYRYKDFHFSSSTNCVAHSYGKVQEFFRSNRCEWLARAYIA